MKAALPMPAHAAWWIGAGAMAAAAAGFATWRRHVRPAPAGLLTYSPEAGEEGLGVEPDRPVASVLIVGDSTALGSGASSPRHSLAGQLAHGNQGLRIVNRAGAGARYADFAQQLQANAAPFDVVLIVGGGNDVIRGTGRRRLRADVRHAAELARRLAPVVAFLPPGNVGNAPCFGLVDSWWLSRRSRLLQEAVREAAQATGARHVDLYRPREHDPFAQRPTQLHAGDGLHPSDEGYRLWMQELDRQAAVRVQLGWLAQKAELGPAATARH